LQGKKIETFHPGKCVYKGDIRVHTLVGNLASSDG
jgi:hypothetical protein